MKSLSPKWIAGSLTLLFVLAAPAWSQEAENKKSDDKAPAGQAMPTPEQMQKMMEAMMPGEHHKELEPYTGKWNVQFKMWMAGPDSEPMVSEGVSEIKWVLDGRFLMETHKGTMMGQPYEGIGMYGYNTVRNLYTMSWFSNMGTYELNGAGSRPPGTNTITYYGEMDESMLDVYGRTVKYVSKVVNNDKIVFSIYDLHAGDDYKVVEVVYTRDKTDGAEKTGDAVDKK